MRTDVKCAFLVVGSERHPCVWCRWKKPGVTGATRSIDISHLICLLKVTTTTLHRRHPPVWLGVAGSECEDGGQNELGAKPDREEPEDGSGREGRGRVRRIPRANAPHLVEAYGLGQCLVLVAVRVRAAALQKAADEDKSPKVGLTNLYCSLAHQQVSPALRDSGDCHVRRLQVKGVRAA